MNTLALRRAYAAMLRQSPPEPSEPPSLERLLDLVEGRGSEAERIATADAALAARASAWELEFLRTIAGDPVLAGKERKGLGARFGAILGAIAILALPAIGIRSLMMAPDAAPAGAPTLIEPAHSEALLAARKFRWSAVPGARLYDLEIATAGGATIYAQRTADTVAALPPDLALDARVEHRWRVVAELPDGKRRASRPRVLALAPTAAHP